VAGIEILHRRERIFGMATMGSGGVFMGAGLFAENWRKVSQIFA